MALTSGLFGQLLTPHHVLLLVLDQLESCAVERLLQLGQVDLWDVSAQITRLNAATYPSMLSELPKSSVPP